jgi:hypothetical protein
MFLIKEMYLLLMGRNSGVMILINAHTLFDSVRDGILYVKEEREGGD